MNYILWIVNICAGIGIIFIVHFTYIFILSKRSKKWKITDGEIISSKMQESNFDDGAIYKAVIQYKYTIGEKEYFSNRMFYGDYIGKNFSKSIQTLVSKYTKGTTVLVYYNPQHPNKSVLEPGIHLVIYRELLAGILLLLLSIVILTKQSFFVSLIQ
jgi:hypothetical protein